MTPTEHTAKIPSPRTGLLATLRALLLVPFRVRLTGTGAHRLAPLALLLAMIASLALTASPASAAIYHPFLSSFDGHGTPVGSFAPVGLAVDNSAGASAGDVYVSDEVAHVLDKFSPAPGSAFLCDITGAAGSLTAPLSECDFADASRPGTPTGSVGIGRMAVDSATGDVYVADVVNEAVEKFSPEGRYESMIEVPEPTAVAVDNSAGPTSGDVYIAGAATVYRFDPSTSSLTTFATEAAGAPLGATRGVAVDDSAGPSAGDLYVSDISNKVLDKFNAKGEFISQLTGTSPAASFTGENPRTVAVDPANGDVYVGEKSEEVVDQFAASGGFLGRLAGSQTAAGSMAPSAVAISKSGEVYVADPSHGLIDVFGPGLTVPDVTTSPAVEVKPTSATLTGTVNPAGIGLTGCRFEYGTSTSYGQSAECEPAANAIPSDSSEHPLTAKLTGLEPGVTYHFRLVASNANDESYPQRGADETLATPPRPSIEAMTTSSLTATSVVLDAQVNPNGFQLEDCHFEYGTDTTYGHEAPCSPAAAQIPPDSSVHPVTAAIPGLEASTKTYHWRLVATSVNGTTTTLDQTFIYDITAQGLPDRRAYEMVSPPQKNGALLSDLLVLGFPANTAADGSRVIASAIQCFAGAQSCNASRNTVGSPYQFTRTSSGWQTTALAPPATQFAVSSPAGYNSNGGGTALFNAPTLPDGEESWYARGPGGSFTDVGPITPPANGAAPYLTLAVSTTADFSHLLWTEVLETGGVGAGRWPFDETLGPSEQHPGGPWSTYEYVLGAGVSRPLLVAVTGGPDSVELISRCGITSANSGPAVSHPSEDGRTVYFAVERCPEGGTGTNATTPVPVHELFARVDNGEVGAHTVAISEPRAPQVPEAEPQTDCQGSECQANTSPANAAADWRDAQLLSASADGSKVFFTSTQQLTDTARQDASNLYEYDFSAPVGERLIDVSRAAQGAAPGVGEAVAISTDASHVYFIATGVLTPSPNAQGQTARVGAPNLYVFQRDREYPQGHLAFIENAGTVSDGAQLWEPGAANVTADGRFLVFTSSARLTADDTSVGGAQQVFRYDAQTRQLVRISIGNDGFNDNGNRPSPLPCTVGACSQDARIAALQESRIDPAVNNHTTISEDGAYVFFQSPVALTPRALDDVQIGEEASGPAYAQNVYEFHAGHVYLISDGADVSVNKGANAATCGEKVSSVCLLGTDATGSNVFFSTADRLVPQDTDTEFDYYDARIGGGFPAPLTPPPCQGESCHGAPPAPPSPLTPPSATFSGQGNLSPPPPAAKPTAAQLRAKALAKAVASCRKKYKKQAKRRATCQRQAHKKYGAKASAKRSSKAKKSARRATTDRRAK